MSDLSELATGLAQAPTAWMLAISLIAVAYLFRQLSKERTERLDMVLKQEAAHRETLEKLYPAIDVLKQVGDLMKHVIEKE